MANETVAQDVQAAFYAALNVSALTNGGLASDGSSRAVALTDQVKPNQAVPYVRIGSDSARPMDEEPHGDADSQQPWGTEVFVEVLVFSDWQPEARKLAGIIRGLVGHLTLSLANFTGSTWWEGTEFYDDNITMPDRIHRVAALRFRCPVVRNS